MRTHIFIEKKKEKKDNFCPFHFYYKKKHSNKIKSDINEHIFLCVLIEKKTNNKSIIHKKINK